MKHGKKLETSNKKSENICNPHNRIDFFKFYLFLEIGEGKEKERERNINQLPLACTPNGDQAHKPGTWPDWNQIGDPWLWGVTPNKLSHTRWGQN